MSYQIINEILQQHGSDLEAAQAHGIASALLCVDPNAQGVTWLAQIINEDRFLLEEEKATLVDLFELTRTFLQPEQAGFDFDLLLPSDEDLQEQAITLSQWCEGFLWGIGYATANAPTTPEITAILREIIEFTKLDTDIEDENEEDAEAFMQIHQYLRAAVLIIRDEWLSSPSSALH